MLRSIQKSFYVEKANPQVVYTLHGFAQEFSEELRERGFYSEPLC